MTTEEVQTLPALTQVNHPRLVRGQPKPEPGTAVGFAAVAVALLRTRDDDWDLPPTSR